MAKREKVEEPSKDLGAVEDLRRDLESVRAQNAELKEELEAIRTFLQEMQEYNQALDKIAAEASGHRERIRTTIQKALVEYAAGAWKSETGEEIRRALYGKS